MNTIYEPLDKGAIAETRESFSGKPLTDPQFEEFVPICAIINREIYRTASFIEKLETYAFAISRTEKGINAAKADTILRDLFKSLFGLSMDQLRKQLLKAEEELTDEQAAVGLDFAYATLQQIEDGAQEAMSADGSARTGIKVVPFYRAFAHQAALMATELGITDIFAKKLMSEQFEKTEGREFYEEGKQFEDKFYRPQIEAEKRQREAGKASNGRSRYNGSVRGRNGSASRSFANGTSKHGGGDPELAESMGVGSSSTSKNAASGNAASGNGAAQPTPANG